MNKKIILLLGFLVIFLSMGFVSAEIVDRGSNWENYDTGGGNYNLKIYNTIINYYNGTSYKPFSYGSCGSNCFRDWNGLIYRVSTDEKKAYVNLYDSDDNYLSSFGFGITGTIEGTNYKYSTLNFTWVWTQEQNTTTNEYVFKAHNNVASFNWTQEFYFYPNQSIKIKNTVKNNLGVSIQNAKFWYIQIINEGDGVWFNGTRYTQDTYKTGQFDSLLSQIKFEDYYVFEYNDLLVNGFNITDFYLGSGEAIGVSNIRISAIGITKGNSIFPSGVSIALDPSIKIAGSGGADARVGGDYPNTNYGSDAELHVKWGTPKDNSYLKFNISSIPVNQVIDNSFLCLYLFKDQGNPNVSVYHVYNNWQEDTLTWNNQPCGTAFDNSNNCSLIEEDTTFTDTSQDNTWQCWNITNMTRYEYNRSSSRISMALHTSSNSAYADKFYSKEYADSNLWPYLNITYHLADSIPPNLSIISPLNQSYNNATILINISSADPNLQLTWWYNGSANLTYTSSLLYTFPQGSNTIRAYANDTVGNLNSSQVSFFIDSINPLISINFPSPDSLWFNSQIGINYSVSDTNLQSCWWTNNSGQTNNTIICNQNITGQTWSQGTNTIIIYVNDTLNNINSSTRIFNIDTISPSISFSAETQINYANLSRNNIYVNVSIIETNFKNITFSLSNSSGLINSTTYLTETSNINWTSLQDGTYYYNVSIYDAVGNYNSTETRIITLDTALPTITINKPEAKTYGYNTSINLNYTVSDSSGISSCWYNLNLGSNITLSNCQNTTFNTTDGSHTLYLYANDSLGNTKLETRNFSVNTQIAISLENPADNSWLNYSNIQFNYTVNTVALLKNCSLYINGILNQTNSSSINTTGGINTFNLNLLDGNYIWNIFCSNTYNSFALDNYTLNIDTIKPSINLSKPTGTKTSRTIQAEFQVSDINLQSCWYNIYRGASIEISNTSVACNLTSLTFNVTVDADFTFNLYANDSSSNQNLASSSFTVSTSSPPPTNPPSGGGGGGGGGSILLPGNLRLAAITNIIVNPGDTRKMTLNVQNIGKTFLNDCKLKGTGEYASWISSDDVKGLSAGESYDFLFTINIPVASKHALYNLSINAECKESRKSTSFIAEILEKKLQVKLIDAKSNKNNLKITYSLEELSNQEQDVNIQILLLGENNERIAETNETRNLAANTKQNFDSSLDVSSSLKGTFNLLINANSNTASTFVQEEVLLRGSAIGGLAILSGNNVDLIFTIILIAVFVVFAFFLVKRMLKFRNLYKVKKIESNVVHLPNPKKHY